MKVRVFSRIFRSARTLGRRLGRDRSGSAVSFVVLVPVMMGAAAVGIETGQAYRTKRQMQGAADAAALAGSIDRMAARTSPRSLPPPSTKRNATASRTA